MPERSFGRWITGIIFLLASILLFVRPGSTVAGFSGLAVMLFLPGFALLSILKGNAAARTETVLYAGALSPLLWFAPAAAFLSAGYDSGTAFKVLNLFFLAMLWVGIALRRHGKKPERMSRTALIIVAAGTLLIVFPFILNHALKLRSDAWFHAAVAELIGQKGIPPTDPFYAGVGLKYFWAYHVDLLLMRAVAGLSLFDSMAVIDVVFFALYLMAIYHLASDLSRSRSGPLWSMLIAVLGVNIAGCVLLLGRAFLGDVRGIAVFNAILHGGVYTVLHNMSFHYTGSLGFFLDKFLVGSSFGPALVLFLLAVRSIVKWLESGDRWECFLAGMWYVSALLFHTVVGLTILIGGTIALCALPLFYRKRKDAACFRRSLAALFVLVLFTVLASPYLRTILSFAGRDGGLPLTFNPRFLWTVIGAGILPVVLLLARWRTSRDSDPSIVFLLAFGAAVLALGTFARMPLGNANKFVYILLLVIIILAGDGVPAVGRMLEKAGRFRYVIYAMVVLCAAGTLAAGIAGYTLDGGSDIPVAAGRRGLELSAAEAGAYRWIGEHTAPGSVFINASRRDLPVLGPREQLWTQGNFAVAWGYGKDAVSWREEIVQGLYVARRVPDGSMSRLSSLGGPVYIVLRPEDALFGDTGALSGVLGGNCRQVFGNESFQIFEILP